MTSNEPAKKNLSTTTVITLTVLVLVVVLTCVPYLVSMALAEAASSADASPIFGVTIPAGYKQWELIAPAEEAAPLNELRAVSAIRPRSTPIRTARCRSPTAPFW